MGAEQVANMYPPIETAAIDNRPLFSELLSDVVFHCDNNQVAAALARKGAFPWMYSFRHRPKCTALPFGAAHGSEIVFVFGNIAATIGSVKSDCKPSPEDLSLSRRIGQLW